MKRRIIDKQTFELKTKPDILFCTRVTSAPAHDDFGFAGILLVYMLELNLLGSIITINFEVGSTSKTLRIKWLKTNLI